jgi:hypothetical protein
VCFGLGEWDEYDVAAFTSTFGQHGFNFPPFPRGRKRSFGWNVAGIMTVPLREFQQKPCPGAGVPPQTSQGSAQVNVSVVIAEGSYFPAGDDDLLYIRA